MPRIASLIFFSNFAKKYITMKNLTFVFVFAVLLIACNDKPAPTPAPPYQDYTSFVAMNSIDNDYVYQPMLCYDSCGKWIKIDTLGGLTKKGVPTKEVIIDTSKINIVYILVGGKSDGRMLDSAIVIIPNIKNIFVIPEIIKIKSVFYDDYPDY
jgi:hypothetical protein